MKVDVKAVKAEAENQIAQEKGERAKKALVSALRRRDAAQDIVKNIDREIADLEASIADGSFAG